MEVGTLEILNVGAGHLTLTVTAGDAIEVERARRIIEDMLRRGYAIFVETKQGLKPVRKFDPKRMVYLIDDTMQTTPAEPHLSSSPSKTGRRGRKPRYREVPVSKSRTTAVGRTAGG